MKAYKFLFVALAGSFVSGATWYDALMSRFESSDAWFASMLFSNDQSPEAYADKVSDCEMYDPFDPKLPEELQSLTETRKAQLLRTYFIPKTGKQSTLPDPLMKIDLLFLMYHYGLYFDNIVLWDKVVDLERLKSLSVRFSNKKTVFVNLFYLEGLCRLAEMDPEAATILDSFKTFLHGKVLKFCWYLDQETSSIYRTFFPICALKLFKGRIPEFYQKKLLREVVKMLYVSDDEIMAFQAIHKLDKFDLRASIGDAFKLNREKLFKYLIDAYICSYMSSEEVWASASHEISQILTKLSLEFDDEKVPSETQLHLIHYFLMKTGKLSRKATLIVHRHLKYYKWNNQFEKLVRAYFVHFIRHDFKDAKDDLTAYDSLLLLDELLKDSEFTDEEIISTGVINSETLKISFSGLLRSAFAMGRVRVFEEFIRLAFSGCAEEDMFWDIRLLIKGVYNCRDNELGYKPLSPVQIEMFNFLIDESIKNTKSKELVGPFLWYLKYACGHPQIGKKCAELFETLGFEMGPGFMAEK